MSKSSRRGARRSVRPQHPGSVRPQRPLPPSAGPIDQSPTVAEQIAAMAITAIEAHGAVLARLRGIVARLGAPEENESGAARPCRVGRLGDIYDKVDTLHAQAGTASELIDYIERQV